MMVDDPTKPFVARQEGARLSALVGMTDDQAARLAIIVTEATTNLLKHAGGGRIVISAVPSCAGAGVDVLALDHGPGMADIGKCLRDGYSTAGSSGTGLGAMARLSSSFDVFSQPGLGTAIHARVDARSAQVDMGVAPWVVGGLSFAMRGEDENGDAWGAWQGAANLTICVADGLGHGPLAATASREAIRVADAMIDCPLPDILAAQHSRLRPTRGAAASLARIEAGTGALRFAGVGNVAGVTIAPTGERRSLVSMAGTLGHAFRPARTFEANLAPNALLVLHSDGLATSWDLSVYPGLTMRHPQLVAGVLYRDFDRARDDITVVVVRRAQ